MFKKINNSCFIIFLISCFLFSCKDKSGPYRVGLLTQLKSSGESSYLVDYKEKHNISIHGYLWSVQMVYDLDTANIVASDFVEVRSNMAYDEKEKELAKLFLDTYYFIDARKLSIFFLSSLLMQHIGFYLKMKST